MSKQRSLILAACAAGALILGAQRGAAPAPVAARDMDRPAPARVAAPQTVPPATSLTTLGSPVTQNFDTLANTGTSSVTPNGWDFAETGTNANTTYTAGTGSGTAGDTYSFGSAGSTERAFGGLQSGSLVPTVGGAFTNNTGSTIASLAIAYTGEQWRLGALARTDRNDFQYSLDATSLTTGTWTDFDGLDFTAPVTSGTVGALDGNAAANRTALSSTITGLAIANGSTVWIRWNDFNATGSDDGLSVDDFSLTPSAAPTSTPTNTPSNTPTNTPSNTPSNTPTNTPSPTNTNTPTNTPSPSNTPTNTPTNTPSNTPTNTPTNTPSNTPTNTPTNPPDPADVALSSKVDTPDPVVAGTNVTWVISGVNNGPGAANGVTIVDTLPAGTTFVSATPSAGSCGGTSTVTCVIGAVANGGTFGVTIVATVTASAANGSTILNTATVSSSTTDPNPGNNSASSSTTVSTQADLSTTKTDGPDPVIAGNTLTYSIATTNNGPSDAQNVTLTDPLPAGTTFLSASASAGGVPTTPSVGSNGTVSAVWGGATAPGVQRTLTITVRVLPSVANGSVLSNTATASASTTDPVPSNNGATATTTVTTQADVAATKNDVPDPVLAGSNLTYTIQATNNGPSDAQTVAVADTVPANTTFVSATPSAGGSCTTPAVGGTGLVNCSWAGATVPAAQRTLTLVVFVAAGTPLGTVLSNTAAASSATTDPTPSNNSATATTTVSTQADLLTVKIDTPDPVTAGNNLTYNITITNNGPSDAQAVAVSDALPAGTTFVSATPSAGGSCTTPAVGAAGTVTCGWAGGTAPAAQRTLGLVVRVLPSVPQGTVLSNTASATTTTTDPNVANNSATAVTTVIAQADLAAAKTDAPDPTIAGNNVSYTVTSTNNGPSDAQTVVIADTIPTTTRFQSATPSAGGACTTPAVNGSGTVSCSWAGATIPTGARSVTIVVRLCADVACNASVTNTASTSSSTTDPNGANNGASAATTAQSQADTGITLADAPEPVVAGTDLTYTSIVSNDGPSNAANTIATYTLDSRLAFVSATVAPAGPTCGAAGQIVTCALGAVGAAGQCATSLPTSYTVTIIARVSDLTACSPAVCPGSPGVPLSSSAVVSNGDCLADPVGANNTAAQSTNVRAGADVLIDDPVIQHIAAAAMAALAGGSAVDAGRGPAAADTRPGRDETILAAPDQGGAECVAVGDYLVVTQTFSNTGPLAFTRQRDNAGPEWETTLPPSVVGQACRVAAGGGTCAFTATQASWDGAIDVGASVTIVYSVRIKGATPSGTVIPFDGTVHYDGFNISQNTFKRVSGAASIALDCPSIVDPNAQLGNEVHLPILGFEGQDDVCDSWIEVQNLGCSDAVAAMVAWGEPGFCPPQATGPLKVECSGVLKPGSAWVLAGAQVPTGAKSGIVFKFSGNPLLEDGIDIGIDDITGFYMCEVLFFGVVGDADDYRRFKKAYDEGLEFQGVDLRRAVPAGGALGVDIVRFCPGDATPAVSVTSKYNGIAGTHLGVFDAVFGGYSYYVPLVYAAKGGYNSILYIQNGGLTCSSVEIWFQQQEDCLRATLCDIATLAPGETYQQDAADCVGPDFQGSAWLRATQKTGIAVDIIGHDLLMTYVGEPAELNYTYNPRQATYTAGNQVGFAPLVYSEYQGWDAAIQVQNLSPIVAAKVKVYFLDRGGDIVTTLVDWVCPRGSQTFFLPLVAALPGSWVGSARVESQEWVAPGSPNVLAPNVVAVAMLTEYADAARTTATQGIAYNLLPEHKVYDWQIGERGAGDFETGVALIAIPGVLKDLGGDSKQTTEIAIANVVPKPGFTDLVIYIYDQNGLIDYVCQKLNEKQVEYIDVQTWGWLHAGFRGSAIISAWFWEHEVTDGGGFYLRNLVGLAAMSITRRGGRLGEDLPGDEAAGERGIPFENTFDARGRPIFKYCFLGPLPQCAGFADLRPTACEVKQESFSCANCPVAIPSAGQAPLAVANVVGHANCTVADVDIAIDITHNWIGDLDIDVSSPLSGKVPIVRDICDASAVSGLRAIVDSDAAAPLGSVCPPTPFAHAQPAGGGGVGVAVDPLALDAFDGAAPTGRWSLSVFDDFAGDAGTIDDWAVDITYR